LASATTVCFFAVLFVCAKPRLADVLRAVPAVIVFFMSSISSTPFTVGKFHITPLSRTDRQGRYTALLSVKSGQGSQTHDSVYTFKPAFTCEGSALMYAAAQGRYWLIQPATMAA
jgi:hypothetical protein